MRSICLIVWQIMLMSWIVLKVMLGQNSRFKNKQRAITPKVWCLEFLSTALLLNEIYLPMKFKVSSCNTFWVILRTKFKNENKQRAITPKVWSFEFWLLWTTLFLNEIYLPMKFFMLMPCIVLKLCSGQKREGWTDGRSDKSITICHPSGA